MEKFWWQKILDFKVFEHLKSSKTNPISDNSNKSKKKRRFEVEEKGKKKMVIPLDKDKKGTEHLLESNLGEKDKKKKKFKVLIEDNKKTKKANLSYDKNKKMKKSLLGKEKKGTYIDVYSPPNNILTDLTKLRYLPSKSDTVDEQIRKSESISVLKDQLVKKQLDFKWGIGLEHEMQLFHKSKTFFDNKNDRQQMNYGNILFDSQESTCYLTGDMDPQGACCKTKASCSKFPANKLGKIKTELNKQELKWLLGMDWELSGRQSKECKKGPWILERVPVLMPEVITGDHRNRTLASICDEIRDLGKVYIKLQKKNPHTRQKMEKYGDLITHPCGTEDNILIPVRPTINSKEYKFMDKPMKDYLGSYHITITLPHLNETDDATFILQHQRFAQAMQWIEPLLITSFFTGDPASVASKEKAVKGSFRIMAVGWGNLAGTDVRKFGTHGSPRGSTIPLYWRNKTKMNSTKLIDYCAKNAPPMHPKAVSIQAGDFRTFSFDFSGKCEGHDCPKVDGGKMVKPNGIEIRIFDHFNVEYIHALLHIVILVAENAQRHPPKDYVYQDKRWIRALDTIMRNGWNGILDDSYVAGLRQNLGLKIDTKERFAFRVFKTVVSELFNKNKHGLIPFLMVDPKNLNKEPVVPETNRLCWAISMNEKYGKQIKEFVAQYPKNKKISYSVFKKDFLNQFSPKLWKKDLLDVIYSLDSLGIIDVEENGVVGKKNIERVISIKRR